MVPGLLEVDIWVEKREESVRGKWVIDGSLLWSWAEVLWKKSWKPTGLHVVYISHPWRTPHVFWWQS